MFITEKRQTEVTGRFMTFRLLLFMRFLLVSVTLSPMSAFRFLRTDGMNSGSLEFNISACNILKNQRYIGNVYCTVLIHIGGSLVNGNIPFCDGF